MEQNFIIPDLQRFTEQVRTVLFGNLDAWKTAINSQTPADLRKFLANELEQMEERLIGYARIFLKAQNAIPPWLWDQHLELFSLFRNHSRRSFHANEIIATNVFGIYFTFFF